MACPICDHAEHAAIDVALEVGASQRQIAPQFGIPKSTLGRALPAHHAHQAPAPAPSPPVSLPTVGQCEAHLAQLQQRLTQCHAELDTLPGQLQAVQDVYRQAVWREQAGRTREAQARLQQLEEQRQEISRLAAILREGIAAAQSDLEAATTRRQAAESVHWTAVLEALDDDFERYCCQLLRFPTRWPPPSTPAAAVAQWGPMRVSEYRKVTLAALRERFPVAEEELVHG